jgi:hypothetical protein
VASPSPQVLLPYLKAKADRLYHSHTPSSVVGLALARGLRTPAQQQQQQQVGQLGSGGSSPCALCIVRHHEFACWGYAMHARSCTSHQGVFSPKSSRRLLIDLQWHLQICTALLCFALQWAHHLLYRWLHHPHVVWTPAGLAQQ